MGFPIRYSLQCMILIRVEVKASFDKVWRGDALAGSGVGFAIVKVGDLNVALMVTHLHAEYYGEFECDRTVQA